MKIRSTIQASIRMVIDLEEGDGQPDELRLTRSTKIRPQRVVVEYRRQGRGWFQRPEVVVVGQRIKKDGSLGQQHNDRVYGELDDWLAVIVKLFEPDWDSIVRWDDGDGG